MGLVRQVMLWIGQMLFLVLGCVLSTLSADRVEEFIFEHPPFVSCHASTLAETASGKLLCAYFAGSEEGARDVGIWLSVQTHGGWSPPRLVAKDLEVPCWNPVLVTAPSGDIILFYKVGPRPSAWSGVMKRSSNEGDCWTREEKLPAGVLGPIKNKPLLLEDGTLLCGSSIEAWHRWGCWIDLTKDWGKTWSKSTPINLKEDLFGIIQPTLFLGLPGQIRLLARSYHAGVICSSASEDGGKTWSDAIVTDLPNPNAGIDAVRLHQGPIVLVYNHSSMERTPLNLAISRDDGISWEPSLVLEKAPGEYSYPSIIQTRDQRIHITYTYNRTHIKHVAIDVSELLEMKPSVQKDLSHG
jgi:predicted neuraminidase